MLGDCEISQLLGGATHEEGEVGNGRVKFI